MERYFAEPYQFIPPYRGTFWYRLARGLVLRNLRKAHGVHRFHFEGLDHFRASLDRRAGILLAPNHCRWADPMVLGIMAGNVGSCLYYAASYHLFRQGRFKAWMLRRLGSYSIWREGPDRESLRESARILAEAERPLVLFPEGTWFRQNDRVMPLQDGLTLITRQAMKQGDRPVVVHPVGIKYWMMQDPAPLLRKRLEALERRLGWASQAALDLVLRIEKLVSALVSLREIELLGRPQTGAVDDRLRALVGSQVEQLERQHLGRAHDGWALERVRRVRQHLTRKLLEGQADAGPIRRDLDVLLLCENFNAHSMAYLHESPTPERLVETVQRIEETMSDAPEVPVVPMGVAVRIGPAFELRTMNTGRKDESFTPLLRGAMQAQIDTLNEKGPPNDWNCPPRPAPAVAAGADARPLEVTCQ